MIHKSKKTDTFKNGFTIIEVVVVIVIIGILATITAVSYGSWRKSTLTTQVKSDLNGVVSAMENARTFNNLYPATIPNTMTASNGVTLSGGGSADGKTYCVDGVSVENPTITYYVDSWSGSQGVQRGTCASGPLPEVPNGIVAWAGVDDYCGVVSTKLYCWGRNDRGQVGTGSTSTPITTPTLINSGPMNGKTVTVMAASNWTRCAIADGAAYCWGGNEYGEIGNGATSGTTGNPTPIAVNTAGVLAGKTLTQIVRGLNHTCVLSQGLVYCWGLNSKGQLGNGLTVDSSVPVAVTTSGALAGKTVTQLVAGDGHTCALADNTVYCWGANPRGSLGNGSADWVAHATPIAVTDSALAGKSLTQLAAGGEVTCVLANTQPYCWGNNGYGQLGNNSTINSSVPVAVVTTGVLSGKSVTQLSTSYTHTCVVASGAAFCWGSNSVNGEGALGDNSSTQRTVPVAVDTTGVLAGKTVMSIQAANGHTCAIATYQPFCWGDSSASATLGNGTTTNSLVPVAVNNP